MSQNLGFRLPLGQEVVLFSTFCGVTGAGAVASLRGCGKEAASVLFWVHIFAIFSMAGWIILYFNILF